MSLPKGLIWKPAKEADVEWDEMDHKDMDLVVDFDPEVDYEEAEYAMQLLDEGFFGVSESGKWFDLTLSRGEEFLNDSGEEADIEAAKAKIEAILAEELNKMNEQD